MLANSKLSWYLRRGLEHEMSAIQYYTTQFNLCKIWGLESAASKFEEEAKEEFEHASRLINFMLKLGLTASATQLKSIPKTKTLKEILIVDWHLEKEVIELYKDASVFCQKQGLLEAYELFYTLLQEELSHLNSIEKWITKLNK
ncbi:MAG: ferritin-like domain-containing protein [Candidatus Thioglobus sp.]